MDNIPSGLQDLIVYYQLQPELFFENELGEKLDIWQEKVVKLFMSRDDDCRRIALKACVGCGKTFVLAGCIWLFLLTQGDEKEHPKGFCLSITKDNLKTNLWTELAKLYYRSKLLQILFKYEATKIFCRYHPETWKFELKAFRVGASDDEAGEALSGLHSAYVLTVLDETGEMPIGIGKKAEQSLPNTKFGKILQAGNPSSTSGLLYHSCVTTSKLWKVVNITGDPDDPERATRVDIEWAKNLINEYGRDNPWVQGRVLGMFPSSNFNTLLSADEIEEAYKRSYNEQDLAIYNTRYGVDVARFGDDRTVITRRWGHVVFQPIVMRHQITQSITARVVQEWLDHDNNNEMIYVDGTGGYGNGVIDMLTMSKYPNMSVINNSTKELPDNRFGNMRAYTYWQMAQWIKQRGQLPRQSREYMKELTQIQYYYHKDKIMIEDKAMIKKRLGFSPDVSDSLALTFATPDRPAGIAQKLYHDKMKRMRRDNNLDCSLKFYT